MEKYLIDKVNKKGSRKWFVKIDTRKWYVPLMVGAAESFNEFGKFDIYIGFLFFFMIVNFARKGEKIE